VNTELLPLMAVPVVRASNLARLAAYYRDVLKFTIVQEVRGVVAYVAHGPVRLQLWQSASKTQGGCRVHLSGRNADLFQIHASLARHAREALLEDSPQLKPWGSWEFSLMDSAGNRLTFVQWAISSVFGQVPDSSDRPQQSPS
jgi:catechol-2,3-dioxygenase